MSLASTILRGTVGGLILGHGLQKLNGSFGGPGTEGTEKTMEAIGLHPAKHQAKAAALSETVGGALTAAGFLSPLGPAMIIGSQAVAIHKVHAKNGVWVTKGGFEYNATLIAAALTLAAEGPGLLSVDGILRRQRRGFVWALLAAALGAGAAAATVAISEQLAPTSAEASIDLNGSEAEGPRPAAEDAESPVETAHP